MTRNTAARCVILPCALRPLRSERRSFTGGGMSARWRIDPSATATFRPGARNDRRDNVG